MRKYVCIRLFEIEWHKEGGGGIEQIFAEYAENALDKFYLDWGHNADRIVTKVELIETYYSNSESNNS